MNYTVKIQVLDERGSQVFACEVKLPAADVIEPGFATPGLSSVLAALGKVSAAK